jgi:hypothetical protein
MSQQGPPESIRPAALRAYADALCRPSGRTVNFEITASRSYRQHDTTLAAFCADRLEVAGRRFRSLADIGTGTACLPCWTVALA